MSQQPSATRKRAGSGRLPDFVIVGAMRSGTSSLARYLTEHPQIHLPHEKELHFFDRHFDKGLDWYRARFDGDMKVLAAGEATPAYMYFQDAVDRMVASIPDAKLIAILRDPVDRTYSHYWHNRSHHVEHLSFADAIEAEPSRIAAGSRRDFGYVDRSRYLPQLLRVVRDYPRERLHVLLFEDLARDPVRTYANVCDFLGVDSTFRPDDLGRVVNRYTTFRSLGLRRISKGFPAPLRNVVGRVNARAQRGYPPMDPEMRAMLRARFAEDNDALARWLGRDLSIWAG